MNSPCISAIERLSTEDGPGLRTVVFFKGCPLRCIWCHNPENFTPNVTMLYQGEKCIGCEACKDACPNDARGDGEDRPVSSERCEGCGACADACVTTAIQKSGRQYAVDELVAILLEDKPYFDNSGGGVTFSGGEPTMHMTWLQEVCRRLKQHDIHIAIQTAGEFDFQMFEETLLPHIDCVFFDIKLMDDAQHQKMTGMSNKRILQNFVTLARCSQITLIPRTPLIPEITDTEENLNAIAEFLKMQRITVWEKLPFNPGYAGKWRAAGLAPGDI